MIEPLPSFAHPSAYCKGPLDPPPDAGCAPASTTSTSEGHDSPPRCRPCGWTHLPPWSPRPYRRHAAEKLKRHPQPTKTDKIITRDAIQYHYCFNAFFCARIKGQKYINCSVFSELFRWMGLFTDRKGGIFQSRPLASGGGITTPPWDRAPQPLVEWDTFRLRVPINYGDLQQQLY